MPEAFTVRDLSTTYGSLPLRRRAGREAAVFPKFIKKS